MYPTFNCIEKKDGIPFVDIQDFNGQECSPPILFVHKQDQKIALFFEPQKNYFFTYIIYKNVIFFMKDACLIGLEIYNYIFDVDDEAQSQWLDKYKI